MQKNVSIPVWLIVVPVIVGLLGSSNVHYLVWWAYLIVVPVIGTWVVLNNFKAEEYKSNLLSKASWAWQLGKDKPEYHVNDEEWYWRQGIKWFLGLLLGNFVLTILMLEIFNWGSLDTLNLPDLMDIVGYIRSAIT
tara:strand:- start:102 stop:509 length:408 start_codon:yes stop_codon:yes gene_type:complete